MVFQKGVLLAKTINGKSEEFCTKITFKGITFKLSSLDFDCFLSVDFSRYKKTFFSPKTTAHAIHLYTTVSRTGVQCVLILPQVKVWIAGLDKVLGNNDII